MSTKFVQARNKSINFESKFIDEDSSEVFDMFLAAQKMNQETGQTMKDWTFTRHNYKGDELGKLDWENFRVTVCLGDLFV